MQHVCHLIYSTAAFTIKTLKDRRVMANIINEKLTGNRSRSISADYAAFMSHL